jgi:hypothetical protein
MTTISLKLPEQLLRDVEEAAAADGLSKSDSHFRIYRRNRRQIIPLLAPAGV